MTDRLEIKLGGALPEKGKFAIVGAAEAALQEFVANFQKEYEIDLSVTVKVVRPGARKAATATAAEAPDEPSEPTSDVTPLSARRHAHSGD